MKYYELQEIHQTFVSSGKAFDNNELSELLTGPGCIDPYGDDMIVSTYVVERFGSDYDTAINELEKTFPVFQEITRRSLSIKCYGLMCCELNDYGEAVEGTDEYIMAAWPEKISLYHEDFVFDPSTGHYELETHYRVTADYGYGIITVGDFVYLDDALAEADLAPNAVVRNIDTGRIMNEHDDDEYHH